MCRVCTQARVPEWLLRKMREPVRTKEELEAELQAKIDRGDITIEEAEHEYQDIFNPEPRYCGREW